MLPLDHPDRIQIAFDDHRLVANAGLLLPVTLAQHVPRQLYLPIPVASLRNVTGKSAFGGTRGQRYFRHSIVVRQRSFGRGVDQFAGHDTSPLLHPPLQRTQVSPAETIRFNLLQSAQQYHRTSVRGLPATRTARRTTLLRKGLAEFARCGAVAPAAPVFRLLSGGGNRAVKRRTNS